MYCVSWAVQCGLICTVWYVFVDRRQQQQQQVLHYSVVGVRHKARVQCLESLGSCWLQGSKFIISMPFRSWQRQTAVLSEVCQYICSVCSSDWQWKIVYLRAARYWFVKLFLIVCFVCLIIVLYGKYDQIPCEILTWLSEAVCWLLRITTLWILDK